jgi:hypothetical protein
LAAFTWSLSICGGMIALRQDSLRYSRR